MLWGIIQALRDLTLCAIWYHLYHLKNIKNTPGCILLSVKRVTLLKGTLVHGCFHIFKIVQVVPNRAEYQRLTVSSYHVTYAFQSESTLYSCLNVKELFARSRPEI